MRVNAEQSSKRSLRRPTRTPFPSLFESRKALHGQFRSFTRFPRGSAIVFPKRPEHFNKVNAAWQIAFPDKGGGESHFAVAPLIALLRNPVFLSTAAGLTVSAIGITIPTPMVTFFKLLGGAFIPCALFAAGLFIAGCSVAGKTAEIGWLVCAKLFLHPLVTWWLAYRVFELEGILPAIAVLQAALPSGVPVFVLAQQYNTFVTRSNAVIVVSTMLSVLTLSGLLIFLESR